MLATRRPDDTAPHNLKPGEFAKCLGCNYYACTPNGLLANLARHEVVENPDGTITVRPSILVGDTVKTWHGYITKGIWNEQ